MCRFRNLVIVLLLLCIPILLEGQFQNPSPELTLKKHSAKESVNNFWNKSTTFNNVLSSKSKKILSDWESLGTVTDSEVLQASIASDGSRLLIHYCVPDGILDLGILKEWDGAEWIDLVKSSNECHDPDIAVKGDLVVASWSDDSWDYGFISNANGPWVTFSGLLLQSQLGMTVTIAQNRPYMSFACRYSDGMPSTYMMLHIMSPIGEGTAAKLNGGWRVVGTSVGWDPAITGDDNAWYAVFEQSEYLWVMKGFRSADRSNYEDIGDGFRVLGNPTNPEIVLVSGIPVVAWIEEDKNIYVAMWIGERWELIGEIKEASGYFYSLRAVSDGLSIYFVYAFSEGPQRIFVDKWENGNWFNLSGTLESSNTGNIQSVDIAVHETKPVVAIVNDTEIKILKYADLSTNILGKDYLEFQLQQNYPNPFNPSTTIKYSKQKQSYVTLKVFDVLGREVAVLVSQEQTVGNYEVEFNAADLTSGIYFYRIEAGNFAETKKMVLMK